MAGIGRQGAALLRFRAASGVEGAAEVIHSEILTQQVAVGTHWAAFSGTEFIARRGIECDADAEQRTEVVEDRLELRAENKFEVGLHARKRNRFLISFCSLCPCF